MTEYERGNTITLTATFKDADDELTDVTNPLISIINSSNKIVLADTEMTQLSTGVYYYKWATTETQPCTTYIIRTKGTLDGETLLDRNKINLVNTKQS